MVKQDFTITKYEVRDIRFPTSQHLDGSDAMNKDPDYSAAYVIFYTDSAIEGHGMTFTCGRGTEVCCSAIEALAVKFIGKKLSELTADMRATHRICTGDSQLRWIGPEKGAIHLATGAVINAVWDLWAKAEEKPLWKLVVDLTPEEFVQCIDFRYITDAVTPEEAIKMLRENEATKLLVKLKCVKRDILHIPHQLVGLATVMTRCVVCVVKPRNKVSPTLSKRWAVTRKLIFVVQP